MSVQFGNRGDEVLALGEQERLRRLRHTVVQRLEALEAERSQMVRKGHPEKARRTLRAFQEVALVLEAIDAILKQ
jgi:hypothetical protein